MRFINPIAFVSDIERSRHFYEHLIGLTVSRDFGNFVLFEGGFAIHDGPDLERTIWQTASPATEPYGRGNLLLYFEHEEIDKAFADLAPHVAVIHPVMRQPWGQSVFRFHDPDGHVVEIGEPQDLT